MVERFVALRRRRTRPGDTRHPDEVVITIKCQRHYLWRAADQEGVCLNVLVQRRRNAKAAKKFFRKLLKGLRDTPRGAGHGQTRQLPGRPPARLGSFEHRRSKYLNNCAENSHQRTRQPGRVMKHFHSPGQAQRFCSAHGVISSHSQPGPHLMSGPERREEMTERFTTSNEVTCVTAAA